MQTLDQSMFKPEPGPDTVAEIIFAVTDFAAKARDAYKIENDRLLVLTVPYDPTVRDSWKEAELILRRDGHRIHFDWHKWDVWTVERGELGGGVPTEWLVRPGEGTASVPTWVVSEMLDSARLRQLAAEALAMAEFLDTPRELSIPGGL